MEEHHTLILAELPLTDLSHRAGRRFPRIDWIQHQRFGACASRRTLMTERRPSLATIAAVRHDSFD
jgi:hypothetical protein